MITQFFVDGSRHRQLGQARIAVNEARSKRGLLLAVGHATLYGTAVVIFGSTNAETGRLIALPAVVPSAMVVWLLLIGNRQHASILRHLLAGYLTAATSILIAIIAIATVSMGRFDPRMTFQLAASVLPLALISIGTGAAVLTLLYGLATRQIIIRANRGGAEK